MSQKIKIDYVWLDGYTPTQNIRSKIKIMEVDSLPTKANQIPEWGFDGSSTQQAPGDDSDLVLKPVYFTKNPLSDKDDGWESYIALCEVMMPDGTPHGTNKRTKLNKMKKNNFLFSVEQEYVVLDARSVRPLGWPLKEGQVVFPQPQGRYYCGSGNWVQGRNFVEKHTSMCHRAGLNIQGTNAEVMLSQWEYQLGILSATDLADELIVARYIMERLSEYFNVIVSYDPKPIAGDWNGSGCHINFSTKYMRDNGYSEDEVKLIVDQLEKDHNEHISVCGEGNERRLTGEHETCHVNKFKSGIGDRGASVRIPSVAVNGDNFYMEDRRAAANCDPYGVLFSLTNSLLVIEKSRKSKSKAKMLTA